MPGYSGPITLSRSHVSFAGDQSLPGWPADPVTGVFGPGWTASLQGGPAGLAGLQVLDNTGIDGSIAFVDEQGEPLVYANPAGTRSYPTGGTVVYEPATLDTDAAGVRLGVTGTGTGMRLILTEHDGTVTTWAPLGAPSLSGTTWRPESISEPGQTGQTTFGRDPAGRVTRILAPVPDGMTGTACPTSGALARGCRAIDIGYATSTTATSGTPGDVSGQVKTVTAWLWNPATSAMTPTIVAAYAYDTSGRLVQVRDPRTGLGTDYTWEGASTRIASVRPSGLAATKLGYSTGRLTQVTREAPTAGQPDVTTGRYVYAVATSGTGLSDLSATSVAAWGQAKTPSTGYAVFGPDYTGPVTGPGVDWSYADLSYVDDLGYTVNTAGYGANAWQVTATDYDTATGAPVRELTATATAAAADPAMSPAQADALSTQTFYNSEQQDGSGSVILPAGARVTDTYGPARQVALSDGTAVIARPYTHTDYDQGAPNGGVNPATGQAYSLPTTVTVAAAGIGADLETISSTTTGYGKIDTNDPGEGDGWALGLATTTTTGGITRTTGYDTLGRITQTRQPLSTGADAGTTRTVYYRPDAPAGADPACVNRPEWAGLTCRTYPAAAPSSGPALPGATTTGYSMWLAPTNVVQTSGTATRTTTTGYDTAGRAVSSQTSTAGLPGSAARPGSYTRYNSDTGLVDYTGWLDAAGSDAEPVGRTSTGYDRWGRATTVTGDAGTVTTTYDTAGRVAAVTDANGTTGYGYDGPGERRGLPTTRTVTRPGTGGTLTWTATYDREGRITRQTLPGRLTQVTDYDQGGQLVALSYLGQVTPVTVGTDPDTGEPTYTPATPVQDQPWLTWATVGDITGRVRLQTTGTGAAFDQGAGVATIEDVADWNAQAVGAGAGYAREYRYDSAGRLTYARHAEATPDPATGTLASTCTELAYTLDANGRRTNLATTTHEDGDCATTGTVKAMNTSGWDDADRPTTSRAGTGTYVYDLLGRQTSLPAADAPNPGNGAITLGYYDDDLPRAITQGETSTTFTLDATGRRATQTSTGPAGITTTVRRYTDDSDNPAWVETTAPGANTPVTTRFAEAIDGDLSATISQDGATSLNLADPHGDTLTTVTIEAAQAGSTPAVTINGWAGYDEYGTPTDPAATDQVDGPTGYGWLGAKQRSTTSDTAGLTLMGVRLYNPTRGLVTSTDPIPGGNTSSYVYPTDPVNQFDLDGRWCFMGVGTTCTRWATDRYGLTFPIRPSVRNKLTTKHGLSLYAIREIAARIKYSRAEGSARVYISTFYEYSCSRTWWFGTKCWRNGNTATVKMIVDTRSYGGGGIKGLVTMYCLGRTVCPTWLNKNPWK
ncbi:hypothetical protein [Intrasporangium sp.]|uniref:RHS repeat protein n=1 Tax=Intrasporangium sp. TaxID=1925024 RepID=UPI003221E91E